MRAVATLYRNQSARGAPRRRRVPHPICSQREGDGRSECVCRMEEGQVTPAGGSGVGQPPPLGEEDLEGLCPGCQERVSSSRKIDFSVKL